MPTVYETEGSTLVRAVAEELKKNDKIKPPTWAAFAKTGVHRERPPAQPDWWYRRSASILRKVFLQGPIGVSKLRSLYGGKRNAGMAAEHYARGSGNIVRKILQQLEKAGYLKQTQIGVHKGRIATPAGTSFLNSVAKGVGKK